MAQPRKVNYQFIPPVDAQGVANPIYSEMNRQIGQHHPMLANTKIALMWQYSWKPDADGHMILGMAQKVADHDRQLHGYDFKIYLNHTWWNATNVTSHDHEMCLNHELCHCRPCLDENDDEKTDETGKTDYRIRKHDIEEFVDMFSWYGQADVLRFHGTANIANAGTTGGVADADDDDAATPAPPAPQQGPAA